MVDVCVVGPQTKPSGHAYAAYGNPSRISDPNAQGTNVVAVSMVDDTHSVPLRIPSSSTHHGRVPGDHLEENEQEAEEVADADGETDPPRPGELADVTPHVLVAEVLFVARSVNGHADDVEDGYEGRRTRHVIVSLHEFNSFTEYL